MLGGLMETQWRICGLLTVGSHEGALLGKAGRLRYLIGAISYPPALFPSPWVTWEPVEENENRKSLIIFELETLKNSLLDRFDFT